MERVTQPPRPLQYTADTSSPREVSDSGEGVCERQSEGVCVRHVLAGVETASLHVLGLLRDCMANLSTQV